MPHGIDLLGVAMAFPQHCMTACLSVAAAGAGAVAVWATNVEGWSAAIAALGIGLSVFIVRVAPAAAEAMRHLTPAAADAIRQIGTALAEVRGLNRKLAATEAKVERNVSQIETLSSDASSAKALAHDTRQKADVVAQDAEAAKREAAELREKLAAVEEENKEKRHELRNQMDVLVNRLRVHLLNARQEIAELKGQLGSISGTHATVINAVSDDVAEVAGHLWPPVRVMHPHLPTDPDPKGTPP